MSVKDGLNSRLGETFEDEEEKLYPGGGDCASDAPQTIQDIKESSKRRKKSCVKKLKPEEQTSSILLLQGLQEMKRGNHSKAMEWLTRALQYCPTNKICLAYRSKCHLLMGENDKALQDIESAMAEDRLSVPSLIQKAETLFRMGDFEEALMYNHRGLKLKSDCQAFKMGSRNCQVAIRNAAGASAPLHAVGTDVTEEQIKEVFETKKTKGITGTFTQYSLKPGTIPPAKEAISNKIAKLILGRAAIDRTFLKECILQNRELSSSDKPSSVEICQIAQNTLNYLQTKQEFLRKQQPIYSRIAHGKLHYRPPKKTSSQEEKMTKEKQEIWVEQQEEVYEEDEEERCPNRIVNEIRRALAAIYGAMNGQYYHTALQWCAQALELFSKHEKQRMPGKFKMIVTLYNQTGTCHLALGDYEDAAKYFKKCVQVSDKRDLPLAKSLALENLGKAYALSGKYRHAIEAWEQKLPLCRELLEQTWLHHELGRAHLELAHFDKAKEHGEQSLTLARKGDDMVWKLNSTLLIAQAHMQSGEVEEGEKLFRKSLRYARCIGNSTVTEAILNVLAICESRGVKTEDDEQSMSPSFTSSSELKSEPFVHTEEEQETELDTEAESLTSDEVASEGN